MVKFLMQTVDGQVKHDFVFGAIEAVNYQNWYREGSHEMELVDDVLDFDATGYIPIGTIPFVQKFLDVYQGIQEIKPINIPEELRDEKFTKRVIWYEDSKEHLDFSLGKLFVKSEEVLKGFTGIVGSSNLDTIPEGKLLVSELIDIDSEWRAFVFRGELVGLQNYLGDFTLFPDVVFIRDCIKTYTNCPPAYTLDVGVNMKKGTFVLEVHNFYSCGLYGFADHKILPQMFYSSFQHLVKHKW